MILNANALAIVAVILLIGATVAWFTLARRVAIPDNRLGFLAAWILSIVLGVISLLRDDASALSTNLSSFSIIGSAILLGLYLLRRQGAGDTISVGDRMPAFTSLNENSVAFDSASLSGSPVLLKFFRGHW